MDANKVDVLAVLIELMTHGGTFEPRRIYPEQNIPRSTGLIANRAQFRPRESDGRWALHRTPSTATVLRALRRAEQDGLVECVGTGADHNRALNRSAASERECYWQVTDAALAQVTEARPDPELIADMLVAYREHQFCDMDLRHLESSIEEQAELLRGEAA